MTGPHPLVRELMDLRCAADLSLTRVSAKTGLTRNTINYWERGMKAPRLRYLDVYGAVFDLCLDVLPEADEARPPRAPGDGSLHPVLARLRTLRTEAGLSRWQVKQRAGIGNGSLFAWESARNGGQIDTIGRVAAVFGHRLVWVPIAGRTRAPSSGSGSGSESGGAAA